MCGIAGYWTTRGHGAEAGGAVARAMADRLAHRGPDGSGVWVDDDGAVALGHRRLDIFDLSQAGHQPMRSPTGRYELAFNGEIYNHLALRDELAQSDWRGHSDTETLLAGFEQWGVEATLQKAVGMFAIALWDRQHHRLTLARDRMGEKPLYYGTLDGSLLFASELKAFKAYPGFAPKLDTGAVALLLRHNYIPAPHTIYQGLNKLPPATGAGRDGAADSYRRQRRAALLQRDRRRQARRRRPLVQAREFSQALTFVNSKIGCARSVERDGLVATDDVAARGLDTTSALMSSDSFIFVGSIAVPQRLPVLMSARRHDQPAPFAVYASTFVNLLYQFPVRCPRVSLCSNRFQSELPYLSAFVVTLVCLARSQYLFPGRRPSPGRRQPESSLSAGQ